MQKGAAMVIPVLPATPNATAHLTDGVGWYSFPALDAYAHRIVNGFSTRIGGVSVGGGLDSLNLGLGRGDSQEAVLENYRRWGAAVGFSVEDTVLSRQDHHTVLRHVTAADRGKGLLRPRDYDSVDGLWTEEPGIALITHYADCTPLLFYAPDKNIIAASHAGWRGTAARIGELTVKKLAELGCNIKETVAIIGPAAGPERYQVDEDCALHFRELRDEQGAVYRPQPGFAGKYLLDIWRANRCILLEAGLSPEHIHIAGLCTISHPEVFYSHRVQGNARGSLAAAIMIRK